MCSTEDESRKAKLHSLLERVKVTNPVAFCGLCSTYGTLPIPSLKLLNAKLVSRLRNS